MPIHCNHGLKDHFREGLTISPTPVAPPDPSNFEFGTFYWQDGLIAHAVPKGWKWPIAMNLRMQWNLWYYGERNTTNRIRPYRFISREFDLVTKNDKQAQTRAHQMIKRIDQIIIYNNFLPENVEKITDLPLDKADEVFQKAFPLLLQCLYGNKKCRNPNDVSVGRLHNLSLKERREPDNV